jgi:hypothetical protein
MTNAEALARTIELADAWLEAELERSEILLIDQGATAAELSRALGPHGFVRKMLEQDRAAQIAEVARWLAGSDGTLH